MIPRNIYTSIQESLAKYPILALTGPRQAGKTTLLRTMFDSYRYVSLENPDNRSFAREDPKGFLSTYHEYVIFDEVQQTPELFSYLQGIVDEQKIMGQFILSGSQNFNLIANVTQSLAGRVAIFKLFPFDFEEMKRAGWLAEDLSSVFTKGFYPAIFERDINQDRYYSDYLETYVKRDVSQLLNIQNENGFNTFLKLCATRAAQLLNYTDLARDAGISHSTAKNWLSILETSNIIFLLPPYFKNYSKRLIKSSKLYFYDVGLLCHLLGIRKGNVSPKDSVWGSLFENMIVSELQKQNFHFDKLRDYYFWRDSHGLEVDLLYATLQEMNIYEIKSSSTIASKLFESLRKFDGIADDRIAKKTLVYGGRENQKRTDGEVVAWEGVE